MIRLASVILLIGLLSGIVVRATGASPSVSDERHDDRGQVELWGLGAVDGLVKLAVDGRGAERLVDRLGEPTAQRSRHGARMYGRLDRAVDRRDFFFGSPFHPRSMTTRSATKVYFFSSVTDLAETFLARLYHQPQPFSALADRLSDVIRPDPGDQAEAVLAQLAAGDRYYRAGLPRYAWIVSPFGEGQRDVWRIHVPGVSADALRKMIPKTRFHSRCSLNQEPEGAAADHYSPILRFPHSAGWITDRLAPLRQLRHHLLSRRGEPHPILLVAPTRTGNWGRF